MKKRILFAEQFYFPEGWGGAQIPRDITVFLARQGFDVEVLCGSEQYAAQPEEPVENPCDAGVRIRRIPALFGGHVKRFRIMRQLWFCLYTFPLILFRRRPDVIVAQTNPPPLIPTLALVSALRRIPLVVIAQDIYPEVMIADGLLSSDSSLAHILQRAFAWGYRRADRVVALGPRMAQRILDKGVMATRLVEISNWATGDCAPVAREANPLLREWDLTDKFVVLYSGNLGVAHDYETLIRAVALARATLTNVHLMFVGGGSRMNAARGLVQSLALEATVSFRGLVASKDLSRSLGVCHLAVVTLLPGFDGLVVPSKLLGHMARAIPSLYIGPAGSDVDIMLQRSAGGLSLRNGDAEGVSRAILTLADNRDRLEQLGRDAQSHYSTQWSREKGLARYGQLIQEVLRG